MKGAHWDPADHERLFYRHVTTGDLGWLVRREGHDCIRLDRPAQEITRLYKEVEWIPEREHRPLTKLQLVQIAFEADKRLCFFLGKHDLARREWLSMKDEQRIAWSENGPGPGGGRPELFRAILKTLERFAGK